MLSSALRQRHLDERAPRARGAQAPAIVDLEVVAFFPSPRPQALTTRCYVRQLLRIVFWDAHKCADQSTKTDRVLQFRLRPVARARRTELHAQPERALCPPRTADMSELAVSAPRGC
jgi:hypothetical protein